MNTAETFWARVEKSDGCWLWTGLARSARGYGVVRFGGKQTKAHRVAYELAIGPIPAGAHILHGCDNPLCVNPEHLRAGTHSENMQDRRERSRTAVGERCHTAKLTAAAVVQIRERHAAGVRTGLLSERYGVTPKMIRLIVSRASWAHLE